MHNFEKSKSNFIKLFINFLYFTQIIKKYHKSYHFQVSTVNMEATMLKPERGSKQPHFHSNMAASSRKGKNRLKIIHFKYFKLYYVFIEYF